MATAKPKSRTYHDPIHGGIDLKGSNPLEYLIIELIDTPEFQRLRRIRQLDVASLTFHGAEGSRFTHSLGVFAVARRVYDHLCRSYPALEEYRPLVLTAALLHDIGHGPFSHASEDIFGYSHESWTERIITGDTDIGRTLRTYEPSLPEQLQQVFRGEFAIPLVRQLVSGQLDCDRLDYLLRDSYFTGAKYGQLDLDRIISVMDYDPVSQSLWVKGRKGLVAIEHYLIVRYFMHTQVYNHPKNLAARFTLGAVLQRARELFLAGKLEVDEILYTWFSLPTTQWPLRHYLAADDTVFNYHIQRWQNSQDAVLAELAHQLVDRDLPKAADISDLDLSQRQAVLKRLETPLKKLQLVPTNYFIGIKEAQIKGYTLYDQGIYLKSEDSRSRQEIADCSPLVRALVTPERKAWLIYPRTLRESVTRVLENQKMPVNP